MTVHESVHNGTFVSVWFTGNMPAMSLIARLKERVGTVLHFCNQLLTTLLLVSYDESNLSKHRTHPL